MNFFKTKYRIVTDSWNGFEAQFRYWWMPFYMQCNWSNTKTTLEQSREVIRKHANRNVVEEFDPHTGSTL